MEQTAIHVVTKGDTAPRRLRRRGGGGGWGVARGERVGKVSLELFVLFVLFCLKTIFEKRRSYIYQNSWLKVWSKKAPFALEITSCFFK